MVLKGVLINYYYINFYLKLIYYSCESINLQHFAGIFLDFVDFSWRAINFFANLIIFPHFVYLQSSSILFKARNNIKSVINLKVKLI